MDIIGHHITAVEEAGSHVLPIARIALDHLVVGLKAGVGDLLDRVGFVRSLSSRHDWSIGDQWEVDTRVGYQVGLEFVQVDVEGAIESEGSSDGRDDYGGSASEYEHPGSFLP